MISKGPFACDQVNVATQRRDPNSLFNWTAQMIRLRKECPEIGWGDWKILKTGCPSVLAIRYDWRGSSLLVVHNFSDKPQEIRVKPGVEGGETLVNLLASHDSHAQGNGFHRLSLEAYGYRWYRVGALNFMLHHRKM